MSTVTKKKEVLLSKKERLLKELAELDYSIENIMEEEWKEQGELILKNIDALLDLVPTHEDGSVDEGHDDPNCLKCVLMAAKSTGKWSHKEYGITILLENRTTKKEVKNIKVNPKPIETPQKKRGRPPKISENQKKAMELGILPSEDAKNKKFNRVLEVDESSVDLPEGWQ